MHRIIFNPANITFQAQVKYGKLPENFVEHVLETEDDPFYCLDHFITTLHRIHHQAGSIGNDRDVIELSIIKPPDRDKFECLLKFLRNGDQKKPIYLSPKSCPLSFFDRYATRWIDKLREIFCNRQHDQDVLHELSFDIFNKKECEFQARHAAEMIQMTFNSPSE